MQSERYWLLPQSESPVNSSLELTASLATDRLRGVRVRLGIEGGVASLDDTHTRRTYGFLYQRGQLSVSCPYFVASIKHAYSTPGGESRERYSPCYFAIPMDAAFTAYAKECEPGAGKGPSQADFDEFIKDVVDTFRLYARQYLDTAIVHGKEGISPEVFGFNLYPDGEVAIGIIEYNKRANDVLIAIEQGGY
jgi:hypothetical protein